MTEVKKQKPLSDEELIAARALILADQRRQWLVSGLKSVAGWIAAVSAAYLILKGVGVDLLDSIRGKS